jgi:hypothetical protein
MVGSIGGRPNTSVKRREESSKMRPHIFVGGEDHQYANVVGTKVPTLDT